MHLKTVALGLTGMSKCRSCKAENNNAVKFCVDCGARQVTEGNQPRKRNLISGIVDSLGSLFRDRLDNEFDNACELAQFGFSAAIKEVERVASYDMKRPRFRSILSTLYLCAADETVGLMSFGGPLNEVRQGINLGFGFFANPKAEEVLKCISVDGDSYYELNKALEGAINFYNKGIKMAPNDPNSYYRRARAYHNLADDLLRGYKVSPVYKSPLTRDPKEGQFIFKNIVLGADIQHEVPKPKDLATKVTIIYEWAETDYGTALELDPTDAEVHLNMSHVQRQQGKVVEADRHRNRARTILNRAIRVDNSDTQSYLKRAEIYEETGEFVLAILDLEKVLTLSTSNSEIASTKNSIERIQRSPDS